MMEKQKLFCLLIAIAFISSIEFTSVKGGGNEKYEPHPAENPHGHGTTAVHVSDGALHPVKVTLEVDDPLNPTTKNHNHVFYNLNSCFENPGQVGENDGDDPYITNYTCSGKSNYYPQQYFDF